MQCSFSYGVKQQTSKGNPMKPASIFYKLLISSLFLISITNCTIMSIQSAKGSTATLASKEEKCKSTSSFKNWTALYGTVPISFLNKKPENFLKTSSSRIKEKSSALDIAVSILLGFTTSISMRTVEIETCNSEPTTNLPEPVQSNPNMNGEKNDENSKTNVQ